MDEPLDPHLQFSTQIMNKFIYGVRKNNRIKSTAKKRERIRKSEVISDKSNET